MSAAIEQTVKALVEFEAQLDSAKAALLDAGKKATKDASDWAEGAKAAAVSKAREIASSDLAVARKEAEAEGEKIREKGEADLKAFESSISKYKSRASELVVSRLLGESR